MAAPSPIRRIGVCLKPAQPQAAGTVRGLDKWLAARGLETVLDEEAGEVVGRPGVSRAELTQDVDLVVVLGGDGTLLSVARDSGTRPVPIAGVNLGTLGYLTEVASEELFAALERILAKDFRVESRMRLDVQVEREGRRIAEYLALNDAVVHSASAMARMIDLDARADGVEMTTYHADGLIVSTPTGSTAYSLSAGGPILDPRLEAFVLTPICSHTLTQRPVVLPASSELEITPHSRGTEIRLTVDGQDGLALRDGDAAHVRRSAHPVHLVVSPLRTRFDVLRTKLRWGAR